MTKIFVDHISPRILYTFDFIFGARGFNYTIVDDASKADFCYTLSPHDSEHGFPMAALMLETGIRAQNPTIVPYTENLECLAFQSVADPIASIFYTLTRYEEYTCWERDKYGRFPREESIATDNWLLRAMCDRWAEAVLERCGIDHAVQEAKTVIIPTFDVDNTFAYQLKSGYRKQLSILKDLLRRDKKRLSERRSVVKGAMADPYDTFDTIKSIARRFPETKVFWLIGKWGKKDRNISIRHPKHRSFIRSLSDFGLNIGLHPSFGSFGHESILLREKRELEVVCGKEMVHSRQHFLRFQVSSTFGSLYRVGFTDEYSMGFAEHVGFRCGTARSHFWFDLNANQTTSFTIHPFIYMDGTLREYMKLSISDAKKIVQEVYDEVRRYGGDFIFIWHNETIGDYGNWSGWREVLDFTLSLGNESN